MLQHHWCNTRSKLLQLKEINQNSIGAGICNFPMQCQSHQYHLCQLRKCDSEYFNFQKQRQSRWFPNVSWFLQKGADFLCSPDKRTSFCKKKHCLQFCKNSRLEKYLFSDHWQKWKLENWVSWQKPFYLSPTRVLPFLQPKNILLDILVTLPMLLFTLLVFSCLKLEILSHTRLNYDTRDFQSILWKSLQYYCDTQCQIRPVTPQH